MNVPKLRFCEFSGEWSFNTLDNLTDVLRCGIAATPEYVDEGIIFLSSQNVTSDGKLSLHKYSYITKEHYEKISKNNKLLKGDILYSRVGAGYGNATIFPHEGDYGVYVSLTHIRANNFLSNSFLTFVLNAPIGKKQASNGVFQGGGVPNLNVKIVEKFKINFPSKPEQEKIASFLTSVDTKIGQLTKKKALLEQYKKGVMQKIFAQEIRFRPFLSLPSSSLGVDTQVCIPNEDIGNEKSEYPEWVEKKLGEVAKRKTTKNKECNTNVLTISAQLGLISQLEFFNKSVSAKDVTGYYLLEKGDFAYNKSYSNGYPMGAIKSLKRYDKGVVSTLYICFSFDKYINLSFMEQYFETGIQNKEIEKVAQEGARNHGLLNIGLEDFFSIKIHIPTLKEQTKIANFLLSLDSKLLHVEKQLNSTKQFKKALLQQMFV